MHRCLKSQVCSTQKRRDNFQFTLKREQLSWTECLESHTKNYYSSCVPQTDGSGIWLRATLPLFLAFLFWRSEFPQRHVSPPSQTHLREGDFHLLWDYSQDMKTGQWGQGCQSRTPKTSLFVTPDIPDIVCVSHESQCLGFDTECSDQHSSFSFTVRVPQAHRDANTHTVSSFLLLSVWHLSGCISNEWVRFGVLCWSASSGVIKSHPVYCTLPPVKSCQTF